MSLRTIIVNAVKTADKTTKSLQPLLGYERYLEEDSYGKKVYASKKFLHGLEDWKPREVRTKDGIVTVTNATLTFLNIAEIKAATSGKGFDLNDKFYLADGSTGPTLNLGGFVDAGTAQPFATEAFLG